MGIFDKLKKVFTKDKEQEKDVQLYTEGLEKTRKEFVSKLNILNLKYTKVNDAYFDELEEKYAGKNVLVVTHAGVSIYVRCYFEGEPKDGNYNNYKLKNCEVLEYDNSRKKDKKIEEDFEK